MVFITTKQITNFREKSRFLCNYVSGMMYLVINFNQYSIQRLTSLQYISDYIPHHVIYLQLTSLRYNRHLSDSPIRDIRL